MDLVAGCKSKLSFFRLKELKDVLTSLGLSKQGKKQDLIDRILGILSDDQVSKTWARKQSIAKEEVARLVEDAYRKMQTSGASDLASKGQCVAESSNGKLKAEEDDPSYSDKKIRCLCGRKLETESLVKCEEPKCQVWQHLSCVIIPEKPMEGDLPIPEIFYCEICRLGRADPFWVTVAHPLYPVKLITTSIPTDGANPLQSVEKTFQLTRADKDLLAKPEYDVQAWCMLLNDKVQFRMQWPQYADLQVNGINVRVTYRPGSQLLGANGRDDGPIITQYTSNGINKICLTGCDARIFCLGVRIVRRRTVQQVLNAIPKESEGEPFEEALARVCRCIGGGATDNADSDSDLEVIADFFSVNLRCPMSGLRMKVAGRFRPCIHMGCFDLEVFVELNQRSRKWQCPICLKNYSLEHVIIDPYFNRITSKMRHCGEDTTEIEVKPDGSWRVKSKTENERRELGDLVLWHLPDGTLYPTSENGSEPKVGMMKQVKQEGGSEGHTGLKLGIRKNRDGFWEVSKTEGMNVSSGNRFQDKFANHDQKVVVPMSSSATASVRDGEDPSVNQDGGGNLDLSTNNGIELDSMSLNGDSAYGFTDRDPSAPPAGAELIVLSDSDDDQHMLVSSETAYRHDGRSNAGAVDFNVPPGFVDSFTEDPALSGNLGLFGGSADDFGMPNIWPLPNGSQAAPGFQLFCSDAGTDTLVDLTNNSINCPTSMNGYNLAPNNAMGSTALAPDSSVLRSDNDINDGLVDNPLALADDPSLQLFLHSRPSNALVQSDIRDQTDVSNGLRTDDWISLSLGGGANGGDSESLAANGFPSRQQMPSREGALESLADTASLLFGENDGGSERASRPRPDGPFSVPRQKRSVKPRRYLSIDDSDSG